MQRKRLILKCQTCQGKKSPLEVMLATDFVELFLIVRGYCESCCAVSDIAYPFTELLMVFDKPPDDKGGNGQDKVIPFPVKRGGA